MTKLTKLLKVFQLFFVQNRRNLHYCFRIYNYAITTLIIIKVNTYY